MTPMTVRNALVLAIVASVALATTAAARADTHDPNAGSPAGTVYEIPLDAARGDAAPGQRGNRRPPAGADRPSGDDPSPIRSENGFGSSSQVPGTAPAATDVSGRDRTGDRSDGGGGKGRGRGQRGSGTPAQDPEPAPHRGASRERPEPAADGRDRDETGPSLTLALSLIALTALVGVGAGTAAVRSRTPR